MKKKLSIHLMLKTDRPQNVNDRQFKTNQKPYK